MRTTPPPPIDITQIFPELADKAKQTVRLHPRHGPEPALHESKMGGLFLWPTDEPWPVCTTPELLLEPGDIRFKSEEHPQHNDNYVTILQLKATDFPEVQFPADKNLFQLLWCPRDHPNHYSPNCKVFWRKEEEIKDALAQIPLPKHPNEDYVPLSTCLHPERVTEYPSIWEIPRELCERIWEWQDEQVEPALYQYHLSTASGTKIGGHVDWIQDPQIPLCECGLEMEHLLTVGSSEVNSGINPRWLAIEDQHVLTEAHTERKAVFRAANLMLGDMGSLYLFVCRKCDDWPIDWVFQCS